MKNLFKLKKERKSIDQLLEGIRESYDILISQYKRPVSLRNQFDLRYRDAITKRLNLIDFLKVEEEIVKKLIGQSIERKISNKSMSEEKKETEKKQDFADRVIQRFADQIKKYPSIVIHKDASLEIKKLFGALSYFEKEYWGDLDDISRKISGSKHFDYSPNLYPEINRMVNPGTNGLPQAVNNYYILLSRIPQDYIKIEEEKKRCLVNIAILLKKIRKEIIKNMNHQKDLTEKEEERLEDALAYIEAIIDDFRLSDLDHFGKSLSIKI